MYVNLTKGDKKSTTITSVPNDMRKKHCLIHHIASGLILWFNLDRKTSIQLRG